MVRSPGGGCLTSPASLAIGCELSSLKRRRRRRRGSVSGPFTPRLLQPPLQPRAAGLPPCSRPLAPGKGRGAAGGSGAAGGRGASGSDGAGGLRRAPGRQPRLPGARPGAPALPRSAVQQLAAASGGRPAGSRPLPSALAPGESLELGPGRLEGRSVPRTLRGRAVALPLPVPLEEAGPCRVRGAATWGEGGVCGDER